MQLEHLESHVEAKADLVYLFRRTMYNIDRNRNVPDVRASLKVGLQMEQGNFHLVRCLNWASSLAAWKKL